MMPTPRRLALSCLVVPLLAVFAGCNDGPAADGDADGTGTGTGTDTGEPTTTGDEPTTGVDDTGSPTAHVMRYWLHVDDTPPPPVVLELDKQKSLEVFGETAARQIHLIDVDSGPLITTVLDRIVYACGDKWDDYDPTILDEKLPADPDHNCNLTELGKTFGATEAERKLSPQYQMVRLLNMTPRNAQVRGTIMEDMANLFASNQNNFGQLSFQDALAAILFCPNKQGESASVCVDKLRSNYPNQITMKAQEADLHVRPFIRADVLATTLRETLLATHPNVVIADGKALLGVTLYDALMDMQPLAEAYGPIGEHPGILMPDDETFTTRSDALTDAFKMIATAESNLRRVEGIDASVGAGEMFVNVGNAPLSFDFSDEKKVQFEGITENPTVDMRMRIMEIDGGSDPGVLAPVPTCEGQPFAAQDPCMSHLPNNQEPAFAPFIWQQPVWTLEYIIAASAYAAYKARELDLCLIFLNPDCYLGASIGVDTPTKIDPADPNEAAKKDGMPDPPGWTVIPAKFQGLEFPAPQYFWEMLLNVGQESLHDFNGPNQTKIADGVPEIEEGDLNPVFALKAVPIGLTAADMIKSIRVELAKQSDYIAGVILGNYWKNNARVDFYYRRAEDFGPDGGAPTLFFVAESDLRPSKDDPEAPSGYGYANPGFFADRELTQKLSRTTMGGVPDTEHEKLRLDPGQTTLYMQDDEGTTFKLEFLVPEGADPTEIVLRVDPA